MGNTWLHDALYTPSMFSDPFAYRARLTDADLDLYDERSRLSSLTSVWQGLINQEEADRLREERRADRERKKEEDRYLELHVDAEWNTSEDSFDEDTPISPPRSPDRRPKGLDLSRKAWNKECSLMKLRRRFDPRDYGFEDYEVWKQYQITHSQPQSATSKVQPPHNSLLRQPPPSSPPSSAPSHPPPILQTRSRQNARAGRKGFKHVTRSQTRNTPSLAFYELGEDGETQREISKLSQDRHARSHTLRTSQCPYRIQKHPRKKIR